MVSAGVARRSDDRLHREFQGQAHVFLFDVETEESRPLRAGFHATWVDDDTLLIQDRPTPDV